MLKKNAKINSVEKHKDKYVQYVDSEWVSKQVT